MEILAEIGKVALEGLLKGDLMFEFGQLSEKVRGEESIIVGLFQLSEYGPSVEPTEMVSFIHKSLQEYLAAWYIAYRCVPEGNLGDLEQHAHTFEDCKALKNVFQFICGLSAKGAKKVFQHVTSVRRKDPTLDLSKTIPDVENETNVPLCDVTDRHKRFSDLVYDFFREVDEKAKLLSHFFYCTGGIVLVTRPRPIFELMLNVTEPAHYCVFRFSSIRFNDVDGGSMMYKTLEFINCLQMPLPIPGSSKVHTVKDLHARKVRRDSLCNCSFSPILRFRNGQFQFFITELSLHCDDHARLFTESTEESVSSSAARLSSEQSCLKFLSSLRCNNLSGQTVKALSAVIGNCKHLAKIEIQHSDDTVCDFLEQVASPSKCSLMLGVNDFIMRSRYGISVVLKSAGAVQLARLLPRFNVITLGLDLLFCSATAVETLVESITHTHKTLERLVLDRLSLTSKATAALGRLLPEMSSLQVLELTGVDGSILQAEDMKALFGRFSKTLPLYKLTFMGFRVTGCLATLSKSLRFFPNLRLLNLMDLNLDERDQCSLLESLGFIAKNVMELSIDCQSVFHLHRRTAGVITVGTVGNKHRTLMKLSLHGINLTPAVAAELGRLLPEMTSLNILEVTEADGSILQDEEMNVLFGGLNKTLPLYKLTVSCLSVTCYLAPLTKSFRFFPNLRVLRLGGFSLSALLESLRFVPYLKTLSITSHRKEHYCTVKVNPVAIVTHSTLEQLHLDGVTLTPAVAVGLGRSLPEMLSLKVLKLTGVDGSILQAEEMEALFGGFNRTLPLSELTFSGFSVRGCLASLTKSIRFFPSLRELNLGSCHMDEHNLSLLLESLGFIPNLKKLSVMGKSLSQAHCCTAEVNPIASVTHKTLEQLRLDGIRLTPAVALVLGRSLPEMPSLKVLKLTGVDGSILEAKEIEALFGGFNKTLPLTDLTFSRFGVRGCLASLTKSLRFFPNLTYLNLKELNMDENDLCALLESFQFIPNLCKLSMIGNPLGHAVRSIVPRISNLPMLLELRINQTGHSEEDLNYLRDNVQQTLPKLEIYGELFTTYFPEFHVM